MTALVRTAAHVLVPAVVGAAVTGVLVSRWLPELPDSVASHWNASGAVDGTSSPVTFTAVMIGVTLAFAAATAAFVLHGIRDSGPTTANRTLRASGAAFVTGMAVFLCGLTLAALEAQRGLPDAAAAPSVEVLVLVVVPVAVAAAALMWFATPAGDTVRAEVTSPPADAPRVDLGTHERAVWTRTTSSRVGLVVLAVALLVTAVAALLTGSVVVVVIGVVTALIGVVFVTWRTTVDHRGVTASTVVRFPRLRVPMDSIAYAETATVSPLKEFGGYGIRVGRGGETGVITRGGDAVRIHRTDGSSLVITTDDAETAVALTNTLVERTR